MAKSAQQRLGRTDFVYPLSCVFKISGPDRTTTNYEVIYERKITVQAGILNDGVNLHLNVLTRQQQHYRLAATAEDGQHIRYIPFSPKKFFAEDEFRRKEIRRKEVRRKKSSPILFSPKELG
ncbi:unnamed protein product, partial [Rotaria sp. Silwood2]